MNPSYRTKPHAAAFGILIALLAFSAYASAGTRLSVMTFNAWGGGLNDGTSTEQTIAAIRAGGADIVGMQETRAESVPCNGDDCPPAGPLHCP